MTRGITHHKPHTKMWEIKEMKKIPLMKKKILDEEFVMFEYAGGFV